MTRATTMIPLVPRRPGRAGRRPRDRQPLARRRHRRREGDPRRRRRRRDRSSTTPSSSASSTSTRAGRRPHVALRGGRQRGDRRGRARRGASAEVLAAHIAERVRERQGGLRAEVKISARYPETVPAPVSGIETQEIYTLFGTAVASERGTRTLTGVQAQGMTACPCAQGLVEERARERLAEQGFTTRRSSARSRRSPSRPTTSAASGRSTSAAPRARASTSTPATCCASSRSR